ncbi:hypothetical protein GFL21_22060 [Rhizobium anhuiense]|uniref:DUF6074 family protein n=1 Tax=Rhizobium anhuiense TaxID=1184720 RepID=UPI00144208FB|nr:DUF6074 family protein [Rhizobium anhuiense]NKM57178.1 hypothetical protein [Rhizobium anhuiense]
MRDSNLPLFARQPPCKVLTFPLVNRIGKIRDVASKSLAKITDHHADVYRKQVTEALLRQFDRLGIPEDEQDEQLGAFWHAVQNEMMRQCGRVPGSGESV